MRYLKMEIKYVQKWGKLNVHKEVGVSALLLTYTVLSKRLNTCYHTV